MKKLKLQYNNWIWKGILISLRRFIRTLMKAREESSEISVVDGVKCQEGEKINIVCLTCGFLNLGHF